MPINIFISYGHSDNSLNGERCAKIAYKLKDDLINSKKYDIFFDADALNKGDWEDLITKGIERADFFLFLVSHKSTSLNGYCLNELSRACELKKEIIPILLDDSFVPLSITRLQRIFLNSCLDQNNDFVDSVYIPSFDKLMRVLDGEEELGFFNKDFDVANNIQTFDSYEIMSHIRHFYGRNNFFDDFEKWINDINSSPVYVLTAAPGVGKSAIASMLTVKFPNNVAGIHFCNFNNSEKNNVKNIIKNLSCQLAYRNSDFMSYVVESLRKCKSLDDLDDKRVFEILLLEPASKVSFKDVQVLIIDGLDEAIVGNTNKIAELIISYQNRLPQWLKIFCTSRPRKEVVSFFIGLYTVFFDEFSEDNTEDIKNYYLENINNLDDGKINVLINKTHGSFLYARTIISNIKNNKLNISEIEKFPDGIYSYYTLWFDRIFQKDAEISYEDAKKVLGLLVVSKTAVSYDFLVEATSLSNLNRILEVISSFFPIVDGVIKTRHKSICDWLKSKEYCPSRYLIDNKSAYNLMYNYIKTKLSARGWKRNSYVVKEYSNTLKKLLKYDELCDLLKNKEFQYACARSEWFSVYETLYEYLDDLKFLYEYDEDYAFEVYESECFIEVFSVHRMKLYNAGLFIRLKECGFSDFLREQGEVDYGLEYEFGEMHYYYISLAFQDAANQIKFILKNYKLEEMDVNHRSEIKRLMMLVYRKLVMFDKIEESAESTIQDSREANNQFEESLTYLTLSKVYCRELKKEESYKACEEAIRILSNKVENDTDDNTKLTDVLFLAEDYRVFADSLIWHKDFEKARDALTKANAIYVKYNERDRYYQRFLYTSLFFEIMVYNNEKRIKGLLDSLELILENLKDDYDEAQILFYKALYFYKNSNDDISLVSKAKELLLIAINKNKAMNIELERLEAETLYNLCNKKLDEPNKYNNRYNKYTDVWINYVSHYLEEV